MLVLLYTLFFALNLGKIASNLLVVVVIVAAAVNRPVITGLDPMTRYVYKQERGKLRYEDSRSIRNEEIFAFLSG